MTCRCLAKKLLQSTHLSSFAVTAPTATAICWVHVCWSPTQYTQTWHFSYTPTGIKKGYQSKRFQKPTDWVSPSQPMHMNHNHNKVFYWSSIPPTSAMTWPNNGNFKVIVYVWKCKVLQHIIIHILQWMWSLLTQSLTYHAKFAYSILIFRYFANCSNFSN